MKKIFILLMMALATCNISAKSNFVQVKDGHFVRDGKPYYYVGTNFWYGAILGSEGQGGNRERLCRELDKMKEMGIDNLRILVGSDGKRGVKTKVEPTLQEKLYFIIIRMNQMIDSCRIADTVSADQSVNLISLLKQKLCQIGTILSCYTCNQCCFLHSIIVSFPK